MKLFVFERNLDEVRETNKFIKRINNWIYLHKEIEVVNFKFGYDAAGRLQTVVVKWK